MKPLLLWGFLFHLSNLRACVEEEDMLSSGLLKPRRQAPGSGHWGQPSSRRALMFKDRSDRRATAIAGRSAAPPLTKDRREASSHLEVKALEGRGSHALIPTQSQQQVLTEQSLFWGSTLGPRLNQASKNDYMPALNEPPSPLLSLFWLLGIPPFLSYERKMGMIFIKLVHILDLILKRKTKLKVL